MLHFSASSFLFKRGAATFSTCNRHGTFKTFARFGVAFLHFSHRGPLSVHVHGVFLGPPPLLMALQAWNNCIDLVALMITIINTLITGLSILKITHIHTHCGSILPCRVNDGSACSSQMMHNTSQSSHREMVREREDQQGIKELYMDELV